MPFQETAITVQKEVVGSDFRLVDDVTFAELFNGGLQNICIPQSILDSLVTFETSQTSLVVASNDVKPPSEAVSHQLQDNFQASEQNICYIQQTSPSKQIFDLICSSIEDTNKETILEDSGNVSDFQHESSTSDESHEVTFSSPPQQQSYIAISPVGCPDFPQEAANPQYLLPHQLSACSPIHPVPSQPTIPRQQQTSVHPVGQFTPHAARNPRPVTLLPKPVLTMPEIAAQIMIQPEPKRYYSTREMVPILPALTNERPAEAESTGAEFVIKKKTRTSYSMKQIRALERIFLQTPYPDTEKIETISAELEISEQKLRIWFQNKRARWRKRTKDNETAVNPIYMPPLSLAAKLRSQQTETLPPTSHSLTSQALMSLHRLSSADENKENTMLPVPSTRCIPPATSFNASDLLVTPSAHLGVPSSALKSSHSPFQQQFFSGRVNGDACTNMLLPRMTNTYSPLNSAPVHSTRNLMSQNSYGYSPSGFYRSSSCSMPMTSTPQHATTDCYFYQPRDQLPLSSYYDIMQGQYGNYTPSFGFM